MNFVKANLDLLIAGLIVVLGIGFLFWPAGGWVDQVKTAAGGRLKLATEANAYIFTSNKPIDIPGYGPVPGKNDKPGTVATYEKNLIEAKGKAQEQMKAEAEAIAGSAALKNHEGRVRIVKGVKGAPDRYIPLLTAGTGPNGVSEEDRFLPVMSGGDPWDFKAHYLRQFPNWSARLGYPANLPPIADEIKSRLDEALKAKIAAQAAAPSAGGGPLGAGINLLPEDISRIRKGVISNRASSIRCYVDENALQKRFWITGGAPPTETEIFEAIVDSWLQNDVVNAIGSLNGVGPGTPTANVGKSPVKRLESITIGAAGMGRTEGSGPIFLSLAGVTSSGGTVTGSAASGIDFGRSLTGHIADPAAGSGYDVIWMTIKIDIDPAYLNKFIEAIYKQNNGYSVLNIQTTPVDPLERASNAYLYGDTQVIHVDMLVEDIVFRSWTTPLMPQLMRTSLGLGPIPVPAPSR